MNKNKLQIRNSTAEFLIFTSQASENTIEVRFENGMIWLSQKLMATLFDCSTDNISLHLKNIFKAGELNENSVTEDFSATATDGKNYKTKFYNLDAIISVGYRVNSQRATQFRQWATSVLRDFAIRGYVLDKERLENGTFLNQEYFAQFIPEEIKKESGSVFYSGENAFTGEKKLYILGLNPGGSPIKQKEETIEKHTQKFLTGKKEANFSEYKDIEWRGKKAGEARLQKRILNLLDKLNLDPHEVPASNVCFVRSSREKNIADKIDDYMELCWNLHDEVIDKLKIKIILCFGKTTGKFVKKKLEAKTFVDSFVENNKRKWKSEVYKNEENQFVIIATHPSVANWINEKSDISDLVKNTFKLI